MKPAVPTSPCPECKPAVFGAPSAPGGIQTNTGQWTKGKPR